MMRWLLMELDRLENSPLGDVIGAVALGLALAGLLFVIEGWAL